MSDRISSPLRARRWFLPPALAVTLVLSLRAEAAVTADLLGTTLSVTGDGADNAITVRVVGGDAARLEVLDGTTVWAPSPAPDSR